MRPNSSSRRAGMYVAVLLVALLVAIIGMGAITAARIEWRTAEDLHAWRRAEIGARAAIDVGLLEIAGTPGWRDNRAPGAWIANRELGDVQVSLTVTDPADGDFADDGNEAIELRGVGVCGPGRYQLAVRAAPFGPAGHDCLATAICAIGDFTVDSDRLQADAPLASNATLTNRGRIDGSVSAVNVNNYGSISGAIETNASPRSIPDTIKIYERFTTLAVPLSPSLYTELGSEIRLQHQLISPGANGTLATAPEGVLLLDCRGKSLRIDDCRIAATLFVINVSGTVDVTGAVCWAPFVSNYPALLLDGSVDFHQTHSSLSEQSLGINLNPSHTPYNGDRDNDTADTYPASFTGLFCISGRADVESDIRLIGVLLAGTVDVDGEFTVTYDSQFYDNPPPGFEDPDRPLAPVRGTWRRVVD